MLATTIHKSNTTPHHQRRSDNQVLSPVSHNRDEEIAGLLPQSPIVCLAIHHRKTPSQGNPLRLNACCCTRTGPTTGHGPSHESPRSPNPHTMWAGLGLVVLLRKEVIQPHLPVRLPCY